MHPMADNRKFFLIKYIQNTQQKTNHCQHFLIFIDKKIACTQTQHLRQSTDDNHRFKQGIPGIRQYYPQHLPQHLLRSDMGSF
jgi:hypothetical protein